MTTEAISAPAEGGPAPVTETATEPTTATEPSGPSRVELERATLDRLVAMNAERKARLAEREKAIAERESKAPNADRYKENPLALFDELGLSPVDALDRLVEHTTREGTEVGKLDKELRGTAKELEAVKRELAELRAEREAAKAERAEAEQRAQVAKVEDSMVAHLEGDTYEGLTKFYERSELLVAANHYAEALQREGKRVTFEDIGQRILAAHKASIARYRTASDASQSAPVSAPSTSAKPKTLTPDLASQSATKTSRQMSWEERLRLIAERESRR